MNANEIYVVEYHAGGGGSSRKQLSEYAPHFYGLETKDYLPLKVILSGTQPNPWRELWQRWFDDSGDPWYYEENEGAHYCFFCGSGRPGHTRGCMYMIAKELLEAIEEVTNE